MYLWTILQGKKSTSTAAAAAAAADVTNLCSKILKLGKTQHNLSGEFEEDDPTNSRNLISGKTCKTCIGNISGPFCSKPNNNNSSSSSSNNKFV